MRVFLVHNFIALRQTRKVNERNKRNLWKSLLLYFHSRIWASYYKATINKRQKGNKIEQMDFFHETLKLMQIHTQEKIRPIIIPLQSSSSGI